MVVTCELFWPSTNSIIMIWFHFTDIIPWCLLARPSWRRPNPMESQEILGQMLDTRLSRPIQKVAYVLGDPPGLLVIVLSLCLVLFAINSWDVIMWSEIRKKSFNFKLNSLLLYSMLYQNVGIYRPNRNTFYFTVPIGLDLLIIYMYMHASMCWLENMIDRGTRATIDPFWFATKIVEFQYELTYLEIYVILSMLQ